jgi:hypothetical protein
LNLEHETIAEQAAEILRLHEQVKSLQAAQAIAHKRAAIAALLVEHGLPPLDAPSAWRAGDVSPPIFERLARDTVASAITSDSFIQSLLAAPDEAAMRTLVRERATLVKQERHWNGESSAAVGWAERSEAHLQGTRRPLSREQTLVESHHDDSLAAFVKAIRV